MKPAELLRLTYLYLHIPIIRGFEDMFPFRAESERQHVLRIPYTLDAKFPQYLYFCK